MWVFFFDGGRQVRRIKALCIMLFELVNCITQRWEL